MNLYQYQITVGEHLLAGRSVILQAPTGAGKTLASLMPFFDAWDAKVGKTFPQKCIYAVPMRILANQFYEEYNTLIKERGLFTNPPRVERQTGEYRHDPEFRADVTFATIDQVLSSWLMHPYSLSRRFGNVNAGAFVGSYLVFDEFHLFDPDSTLPTTLHMLKMLKGIAPFVLMTATFSAEMLTQLAKELDAEPILLSVDLLADIKSQDKTRFYHTASKPLIMRDENRVWHVNEDAIIAIRDLHLAQEGKQRTLIVCNQVERAQRIYDALCAAVPKTVKIRLLHSRFRQEDRQAHEQEIQREYGKNTEEQKFESMIVVATQVVEVGLDMSATVLHTELAPASSVLQRAGRCARRQGEVGHVYVYPTDSTMPYSGKLAKQQCELTLQWLQQHDGQPLDFEKEQQLINFAHGKSDEMILEGLKGGGLSHKEAIETLWLGDGNRGEAARPVRHISSLSLAVHSNPDQLLESPFQAETFSLHPGTVMGAFTAWKSAVDEEGDEYDWTVCKLWEDPDEGRTQANEPLRYEWERVKDDSQLMTASMVVVRPELVGYSAECGLTLYPGVPYQSTLPEKRAEKSYRPFTYRLESYEEHIKLVYQAFEEAWEKPIERAGILLENRFGWTVGTVLSAAQLVVLLHDVGKLREGWQEWAKAYHHAIGNPLADSFVAAHTLSQSAEHRTKARDIKLKRPHHAVEGALATTPLFKACFPDNEAIRRAAFTAICRHHTPTARTSEPYNLISQASDEITKTLKSRVVVSSVVPVSSVPKVDLTFQDKLSERFMIRPRHPADMTCYMLFVRALRFADGEGTKRGSI